MRSKKETRDLIIKRVGHCMQEFCMPCREITTALKDRFGEDCTSGNIKFKPEENLMRLNGYTDVAIDNKDYQIVIKPLYDNINMDGLDPQ